MENPVDIFDIKLRNRIMRRVYAQYVLRRITAPTALRGYMLGGAALGLGLSVSLVNIFNNAPRSTRMGDYYAFSSSAWSHASLIIQALCGAIILFGLWFFKDVLNLRLPKFFLKLRLGWF